MQRPLPREAFDDPATYAGTRLPVEFASTLIPDAYTSPGYHELETAARVRPLVGLRRQ